MIPWVRAWQQALYADSGFYRSPAGPAGHFATSCHGPPGLAFAEALIAKADQAGLGTIVDLGAGRGELLRHLATVRDDRRLDLRLVGVDVVSAPALPAGVEWRRSPGGPAVPGLRDLGPALVIANEWLDVVPCVIAEVDATGETREVLVDTGGRESLGEPLGAADREWVDRWWPLADADPGARVEIGRSRDEALARLLDELAAGLALTIDYGHTGGDRPVRGSLTGYRAGRQVPPVPDGSCDLTAHVAMDSLRSDRLVRQRDALGELGIEPEPASYELARSDPAAYLTVLQRNSAIAQLRGPGLGDFWWAITGV